MRITKERDEEVNGWYYADPQGKRVSPTYEHEGVLDKWAEVHGAYTQFVVFKRELDSNEEEIIAHYEDHETADRASVMGKRDNPNPQFFFGVRTEMWIGVEQA